MGTRTQTQTLDTHPLPHDGIYSVRDKNYMNTQSSLKKMCLNKDSLEGRDEDKMADLIAGCLLQIICRQSGIHISTLTDLKTSSLFFHSYHYWLTDWPLKQMRGSTIRWGGSGQWRWIRTPGSSWERHCLAQAPCPDSPPLSQSILSDGTIFLLSYVTN